jgi:hypothetical protein
VNATAQGIERNLSSICAGWAPLESFINPNVQGNWRTIEVEDFRTFLSRTTGLMQIFQNSISESKVQPERDRDFLTTPLRLSMLNNSASLLATILDK